MLPVAQSGYAGQDDSAQGNWFSILIISDSVRYVSINNHITKPIIMSFGLLGSFTCVFPVAFVLTDLVT